MSGSHRRGVDGYEAAQFEDENGGVCKQDLVWLGLVGERPSKQADVLFYFLRAIPIYHARGEDGNEPSYGPNNK